MEMKMTTKDEAHKQQGEPVAWVQPNGELVVRADYGGRLYYSEQNLYTSPQPAQQQDTPKIGCVNHDCDKCKAQQQEPVATVTSETDADISMSWWHEPALPVGTKLYTSPPASKPWVGLTDEDIERLSVESGKATFLNDDEQTGILWFDGDCMSLSRAIEAKLREKNA